MVLKSSAQALNFTPHGHDTDLNFLDMDDSRSTELSLSESTHSLKTGVLSVQVDRGCLNDLPLAGGRKVRLRYIRGTMRPILYAAKLASRASH